MAEGISRIGIISLVSAADTAPVPSLAPPGLGLRRDPSGALGGAGAGGEAQQSRPKTGMSASALELAAAPYAAPLTSAAASNQKLLLLAAFLQVGQGSSPGRAVCAKRRALRPSRFLAAVLNVWVGGGGSWGVPALPPWINMRLACLLLCKPSLAAAQHAELLCLCPCLRPWLCRSATGSTRSS